MCPSQCILYQMSLFSQYILNPFYSSSMSKYADSHKKPNGPGDARPTAMQIVEDEGRLGTMKDKVPFFFRGPKSLSNTKL